TRGAVAGPGCCASESPSKSLNYRSAVPVTQAKNSGGGLLLHTTDIFEDERLRLVLELRNLVGDHRLPKSHGFGRDLRHLRLHLDHHRIALHLRQAIKLVSSEMLAIDKLC